MNDAISLLGGYDEEGHEGERGKNTTTIDITADRYSAKQACGACRLWDKQVEEEYDEYVCQSSKYLVTGQCVFYFVFAFSAAAAGFKSNDVQPGLNASALGVSLLCTSPLSCDTKQNLALGFATGDAMRAAAIIYSVMYFVQACFLVATTVLIWIPKYQRRWSVLSTIFMSLCAFLGPMGMNVWLGLYMEGYAIRPLLRSQNITVGDAKAILLDAVLMVHNQRYSDATPLTLFAFAPRFVPFCVVCLVLLAVQWSSEMVLATLVYDDLVFNSR